MKKTTLECFFDGACYPKNPYGTMGMGACINEMGIELWKCSHTIPASKKNSNNVAEYLALEYTLDYLLQQKARGEVIVIKGDSKLVIEQMNGVYKIKNGMYVPVAVRCKCKVGLLKATNDVTFKWIPREQNSYCDKLSGGDNFKLPHPRFTGDEIQAYCIANNCKPSELIAAHKKLNEKVTQY